MKLTKADKTAIQNGDSNYLLNKGVHYYHQQDFEVALEYYHLAAAMGNGKAIGNIGNCYMAGEGVPAEADIAFSYYRIAMDLGDVDSFYHMGKIYCDGNGVEKDTELGVYYYESALAELLENETLQDHFEHPALFYELALQKLSDGELRSNLSTSYKYLLVANMGYTLALKNGAYYLESDFEKVKDKMTDTVYDDVRSSVKKQFKEEYMVR